MKLSDLVQETKDSRGKIVGGMTVPIVVGIIPYFGDGPKILVKSGETLEIAKQDAGKADSLREIAVRLAKTQFNIDIETVDLKLGWSGKMTKSDSQYGFYVYCVKLDKEVPGKMVSAEEFQTKGRQSQRAIVKHVLDKCAK